MKCLCLCLQTKCRHQIVFKTISHLADRRSLSIFMGSLLHPTVLDFLSLLCLSLQGSLVKTIIISNNTHQDLKISQRGSKQTKQYPSFLQILFLNKSENEYTYAKEYSFRNTIVIRFFYLEYNVHKITFHCINQVYLIY